MIKQQKWDYVTVQIHQILGKKADGTLADKFLASIF